MATTGNLVLLNECLRRDPESYHDEFMEQFQHFLQFLKLLELEQDLHRSSIDKLSEVLNFLITSVVCYKEEAKIFGEKIVSLLKAKAEALNFELRLIFCRSLMSLRNARHMDSMEIIPVFFDMLKCDDKQMRQFIKSAIISIIKNSKKRVKSKARKNHKNRPRCVSSTADCLKIRTFIFSQVNDSCSTRARVAHTILVKAYKKGLWRDDKVANVLADCVFNKLQTIQVSTMKFLLGSLEDDEEDEGDSDSESENKKDSAKLLQEVTSSNKYAKKTRKRKRELEKTKKEIGKMGKSQKETRSKYCNLEGIMAIYDPQNFTDKLLGSLEQKKNEKFFIRLLQITLCARLIGLHRLQALGFYSYIQRYIQTKQPEVTKILLCAAQACHDLVPTDLVENLIRRISMNFVSDQNTPEAMTVGLNTIREIFASCPAAANEDLLKDLIEYKSYKNKNVSMAARGIIMLFRTINPKLLPSKFRGRPSKTPMEHEENLLNKLSEDRILTDEDFRKAKAKRIGGGDDLESEEEECSDDDSDDGWETVEESESDGEESAQVETNVKKRRRMTNDEELLHEETKRKITRKDESLRERLPRLTDIEHFHKKIHRQTKAERRQQAEEGRDTSKEFGKPKKNGPHVGRTNRELSKRKNFQMIKPKMRGKNRQRSFRDRQISLRNYLLKQQGKNV